MLRLVFGTALSLLALLGCATQATAQLTAGSIAFTGFNSDGNDNLAFVALTPITAGTVISFSDNEYVSNAFNTGESAFRFTAGSAIAVGTIVTIDNIGTGTISSNLGTVVFTDSTNRGVANSGETVYAFSGNDQANPGTFIAAVTNNGNFDTASSGVLTGTGLTSGQTALALPAGTDIAEYTGSRSNQADFPDYLPLLNTYDTSRFLVEDAAGDQSANGIAPDVPFNTTAFTLTPVPEPTSMLAAAAGVLGLAGVARRRAGRTGG